MRLVRSCYGMFLFIFKLNFPYFPYLLLEEIYNRLGKKTRFEETDLWYLLYSLAAAKEEIRKYGLTNVGDIRTGNVFLND